MQARFRGFCRVRLCRPICPALFSPLLSSNTGGGEGGWSFCLLTSGQRNLLQYFFSCPPVRTTPYAEYATRAPPPDHRRLRLTGYSIRSTDTECSECSGPDHFKVDFAIWRYGSWPHVQGWDGAWWSLPSQQPTHRCSGVCTESR